MIRLLGLDNSEEGTSSAVFHARARMDEVCLTDKRGSGVYVRARDTVYWLDPGHWKRFEMTLPDDLRVGDGSARACRNPIDGSGDWHGMTGVDDGRVTLYEPSLDGKVRLSHDGRDAEVVPALSRWRLFSQVGRAVKSSAGHGKVQSGRLLNSFHHWRTVQPFPRQNSFLVTDVVCPGKKAKLTVRKVVGRGMGLDGNQPGGPDFPGLRSEKRIDCGVPYVNAKNTAVRHGRYGWKCFQSLFSLTVYYGNYQIRRKKTGNSASPGPDAPTAAK